MKKRPTESNSLRQAAEVQLSQAPTAESLVHSNEKLLHELQVHQVQLEMQNEELRRIHLALEEAHDSYVDLYEHAPVGYLTLTHDGLIDKINLTAVQLLGPDRRKLLSRRFSTLVAPKDGDKWYLFLSNVMKCNERQNIELTLKRCDNTEIAVQLDCLCINSMLRVTLTDITKIKQSEAALHEAETIALISAERIQTAKVQEEALNRLQKITSQLPGMAFQFCLHVDGSSHCSFASEAIHEIYRLSPEEVRADASKLLTIIHPDDYDGVIAAMQKSAYDLSPFSYEYRVKFDDGTERWLMGNSTPQRKANGSTLWHGFVTDITKRKLAEQETYFHATLLSAIGQAVIATDTIGRITYMNHVAESLYGWRSDEALGHSILEVTDPQMSRAQAENILTGLAWGDEWSNEIFVKHRNGTTFPVEVHDTPILDAKGTLIGIICVASDITERKRAEDSLKESEARFRAYVEQAADALFVHDSSGRFIDFNNQACVSLGYSRMELSNMSVFDVEPDLDLAQAQAVWSYILPGQTCTLLGRHRRKDGTTFPVEIRFGCFDLKGMQRYMALVRDITDIRQAETALRENNKLLSFSMQLSHMGNWDLNLVDHTIKRTLEHDRIFGYESLLPQWSYEIFLNHVLAEDRFEIDRLFQNALSAQKDWNSECRIRRADGEIRWILVAGGHHRNDHEEVSSMYGIIQDITEQKCLVQMIQEKNADLEIAKSVAEKANLAKSEFLSRMSHELRTPLNSILGYAQLLEVGSPPLSAFQLGRLQPIIKAGWYLLELINEILDLARIESGNLSLSAESLRLLDVMEECQAFIQPQAKKSGIQLNFIPCDSSWTIYADRTRIKQVLLNLLSNAIKYNREHGMVEVKCTRTSEFLCIYFKDTGMGLSPEMLPQLFQPFNRLGQEAGTKEGTGIGLVVAKQLVEQMGGSISVKSTVGLGSEFCVKLLRDDRQIHPGTKT